VMPDDQPADKPHPIGVVTASTLNKSVRVIARSRGCRLTKKAEPPPTRDVNRDSGTDRANGGWLRRLVRRIGRHFQNCHHFFGGGGGGCDAPGFLMRLRSS
jgi:hypothetical protein